MTERAMIERWLVILGACGLLGMTSALAVGCKAASCEDVCEQQNTCEGAQQIPDCQAHCESQDLTVEAAGCRESYDAWLSCQGTVSSCDTQSTFCTGQNAAYLKCLSDACSADPSKC
jgi:hypothetical protein